MFGDDDNDGWPDLCVVNGMFNVWRQGVWWTDMPLYCEIFQLVVRWPTSGKTQTFREVAANRIIRITEGRDEIVDVRFVPAAAGAGAPETP